MIPHLIARGYRVNAHRFADSCVNMIEGRPYWRDVGTLDAFWEANIDLIHVTPDLNLYDEDVADLDLPGAAAARQVRVRRRRAPGHRDRLDGIRRLHRQRLDLSAGRCCFRAFASTAIARSRTR